MLIIGLGFLAVFALRFRKDRRRLGNGVLLLLGLLFAGVWALDSSATGELPVLLVGLLLVLAPLLVLVVAGLLVANGVQMMRREGLRIAHLLSVGLGLAVLGPYVLLVIAVLTEHPVLVVACASVVAVISYIGFVFVAFLLYSLFYGWLPYRAGMDAIVVHGSRLRGDRVSPLLASRLDRAVEVYGAEVIAGRRPLLITSGGKGSGEAVSEASAMAGYLLGKGVPSEAVVLEDRSTTTRENLMYTRDLLHRRGSDMRMVLVTSNFHILRTAILARRLDLDAEVVGSKTALYYLPSAILREFAAVLLAGKWVNIIACLALALLPVLAALV
ncbi:YdcF family protein [Nocardia australiensis]|uniref:YdcF family protein n=1 Tax=Nocardia australiensis TaxID=2887191 RepID=UPI001D155751|nr:YdcF family protein [Nocardia australiensis]